MSCLNVGEICANAVEYCDGEEKNLAINTLINLNQPSEVVLRKICVSLIQNEKTPNNIKEIARNYLIECHNNYAKAVVLETTPVDCSSVTINQEQSVECNTDKKLPCLPKDYERIIDSFIVNNNKGTCFEISEAYFTLFNENCIHINNKNYMSNFTIIV